jgi:hypothetical protein
VGPRIILDVVGKREISTPPGIEYQVADERDGLQISRVAANI